MLYGSQRVEALVDADVFALPSYQENFGIVVAEALAAGCPVIISDQVNIYGDVIAADAGAVVPCDIGAVANELTRWMGDAALRRIAGERGRAMAFNQYDAARIAQRWMAYYEKMIPGGSTK
jgi:glycosyltransferase involved in cell wall biosynthesis